MSKRVVQMVISRLKHASSREEFLDLHRQTAEWMKSRPECLSYEVYEGEGGAIADRIIWSSGESATRANEEYARTTIADGMRAIVDSYTNFFGVRVEFE